MVAIVDEHPEKWFAYKRAAYAIESIPNLKEAVERKTLESFPGIGRKIATMITTLFETGILQYYEDLKSEVPESLLELTHIPGLTVKKLRILYETFLVTDLESLENALRRPGLKLKGFGPAFVKKLLDRIDLFKKEGASVLYPEAVRIAERFLSFLRNYTTRVEIAGELRRKLEIIYQLDFVATSSDPETCLEKFAQQKKGIKASLTISNEKEFAFTLFCKTGNERHVQEIEKVALKKKVSLKDMQNEGEGYARLGLPFIEPELREGYGEIKEKLPKLIEFCDLRGTFHCHTIDSDGTNTLVEMIQAGKELGWEYIGISDHSKSSTQANGMNEETLFRQIEEIKKLNAKEKSFQLLSGLECDILKDGELDFSNDVLKELDFVIVSIHRYFSMEEKEMTQRMIKAIENPYTTMVGHLTGRLLRHRNSYQLNIEKVIDACIQNDVVIELNAYPNRLDMDWRYWKKAKEKGVKCSINPDAHSLRDLKNCEFGINMARKGWLEKSDVINTKTLNQIKKFL